MTSCDSHSPSSSAHSSAQALASSMFASDYTTFSTRWATSLTDRSMMNSFLHHRSSSEELVQIEPRKSSTMTVDSPAEETLANAAQEDSPAPVRSKSGRSPAHNKKNQSSRKERRRVKPLSPKATASCGKMWIRPVRNDEHRSVSPSSEDITYQGIRMSSNSLLPLTSPFPTSPSSSMDDDKYVTCFIPPPSITTNHQQGQRSTLTFGESGRLLKPIGFGVVQGSLRVHRFLLR